MAKAFFENRFLLTRKLHKEFCKKTFHTMRKKIKITCLILFLLSFAATVLLIIFTRLNVLATITLILAVYFFFMIFYGYVFSERINYKSLCAESADVEGGEVVMFIRFEPSQIRVRAGKTAYAFKYSSIDQVIETENLFIFILRRAGMIEHSQLVFKGGFTEKEESTLSDFKKYINDKTEKEIFEL